MTIAHCFRFPGDFQSNCTAKALSRIFCHPYLSLALANTCPLVETSFPEGSYTLGRNAERRLAPARLSSKNAHDQLRAMPHV
jgi:hypothetical protein